MLYSVFRRYREKRRGCQEEVWRVSRASVVCVGKEAMRTSKIRHRGYRERAQEVDRARRLVALMSKASFDVVIRESEPCRRPNVSLRRGSGYRLDIVDVVKGILDVVESAGLNVVKVCYEEYKSQTGRSIGPFPSRWEGAIVDFGVEEVEGKLEDVEWGLSTSTN